MQHIQNVSASFWADLFSYRALKDEYLRNLDTKTHTKTGSFRNRQTALDHKNKSLHHNIFKPCVKEHISLHYNMILATKTVR